MKTFIFKSKINIQLGQSGVGLLEVMIAAAIIGVLCLGMGSVAANMSRVQAQANLYGALNMISLNMQRNILDANAWRNTIAATTDNPTLSCIYSNTACNKTSTYPQTAGNEINYAYFNGAAHTGILYDGNATPGVFYSDNGTNGFTYAGEPCTGFSTSTGTDSCPISYRLRVALFCSDFSASCVQPSVLVYGILQYSPGNFGKSFPVNPSRYSVGVSRVSGAYNRNDSIRLEDQTASGANPPNTTGNCPQAGTPRIIAPILDTAGNIVGVPAGGLVTLKAGGYVCNAIATGYGVDGFSISIRINSLGPPYFSTSPMAFATATAPIGMQQARITDLTITQNSNFTIELIQNCQSTGGGTGFGIPLPAALGVPNVYAGLYCTRLY